MQTSFTALLIASSLSAGLALPVMAATPARPDVVDYSLAIPAVGAAGGIVPTLVSDDDDDDDDDEGYTSCGDDDEEDDDDDPATCADQRNAAPTGTANPPQNGLFGNGAPPQAQVN